MTCLSNAARAPVPFHKIRGLEARENFAGLSVGLLDLIEGAAGCSPYICSLLERHKTWLSEVADSDLDGVLDTVLDDISGDSFAYLSKSLRVAKQRIALLAGLADLGGLWDLGQVTGALTRLADRAVQASLDHLLLAEFTRGKLPGVSEDDLKDSAGMVVLAMGKMGAFELNYSSDIDLIVLFDETRHDPDNYAYVRSGFIRVTQRMVKLLSEVTGDGYVFRTDLRLRPDPSSTAVCIAMEPAERYYESLGRTWERAAYIKARPCAGDIAAGWEFLDRLKPFIWRKYLDFAAIQDAHDMRLRIREHRKLSRNVIIPGHDMKLGVGGIREIEFFTQTRQIISGGRDPDIRQRQTLQAMQALVKKGWVKAETAKFLSAAYVENRNVEHRLQMLEDAQTHKIPESEEKRQRLAAFCGYTDLAEFENIVAERLEKVNELTEEFFASDDGDEADFDEASFERPEFVESILEKWATIPALRSERAQRIFARIRPEILSRLASSSNPEEALIQLDTFLSELPSGVQLFSLFEANTQLLDLLIDICATAPELARYLGKNVQVFDAVVSPDFFESLPDFETLKAEMQAAMPKDDDYEEALNVSRRWVKEKQFRIGVHLLRRISDADEAAMAFSNVAEACLSVLYPVVCQDFASRYGVAPGKGAGVIAMGKLGSREMTSMSDLDLIIVYDAMGAEQSDGKRPLAISAYFSRLTQALVSALTVPTAEGSLFKVDMRLRPSGRSGPVATAITAFAEYQENSAWTWEHLALSRARVVAGSPEIKQAIDGVIHSVLSMPHDSKKVIADIKEMREKLAEASPEASNNPWEIKRGPGRLLDIEMLLQAGAIIYGITDAKRPIDMLPKLVERGYINASDGKAISAALTLFRGTQQTARLAVEGTIIPKDAGQGFMDLLVAYAGVKDVDALETLLDSTGKNMARIIDKIIS